MNNSVELMNLAADNIRILSAAMVEKAHSGHPGGAMGGADFINVLFSEYLVYDPDCPEWDARDRFFLDPGHMSPMLCRCPIIFKTNLRFLATDFCEPFLHGIAVQRNHNPQWITWTV